VTRAWGEHRIESLIGDRTAARAQVGESEPEDLLSSALDAA